MSTNKNYTPQLPQPVNPDWDSALLLIELAKGYNQLLEYLAAQTADKEK